MTMICLIIQQWEMRRQTVSGKLSCPLSTIELELRTSSVRSMSNRVSIIPNDILFLYLVLVQSFLYYADCCIFL